MSDVAETLSQHARKNVAEITDKWIRRAEHMYGISLQPISVSFDLRGRTAGMFRVKDGVREIRFNPWIFSEYFEENLNETIPHEVAHATNYVLHGTRGVKPHGAEWKRIMMDFGVEPRVTCEFRLDKVPQRKVRRYDYRCACTAHQLTAYRHNKITRRQACYVCKFCRTTLYPA
ncbi:MAG: SprT-like domain-containing protein [Pseudomonadota bacterium]